ncbi:TetR/AcrR family transcriptional regulator [Methylobacterium planeticum]|uniref:TetR/AcrR family transcriptional regulator n=1 Tax=Methylobacterium planeticum TaxID=2615211 RepID=A0A6N6MFM8_9HYPH|nr:TetR/AcrR family transcriptional regulator [Methylobacterium planeticum]KAB1068594.1 TetR/AcrR family transcriptional regulator [Methylobacterium planeticum]
MNTAVGNGFDAKSGPLARREHILDTAQACFVRNGFRRTTMIDLARESAIGRCNFHRYFGSKEAIVEALARRDRARCAVLVAELGRTASPRAVLTGVLTRTLSGITRETAVLRLDLWAEAKRNAAIAAVVERTEEARAWLGGMFSLLALSPRCQPEALFDTINPLMKGIIVNRAVLLEYDSGATIAFLDALIDAGLRGELPHAPFTAVQLNR